jgi:error-prone DNA polymerase
VLLRQRQGRLIDRSGDLSLLSDDRLGQPPVAPNGAVPAEPLHDDRLQHPDNPAQKLRHPRNVRIQPRSRDFH